MDIRNAIKKQYHASLAMLKQAIERCPDELWTGGEFPRSFWRIAYHTLFYTHLYLQPTDADFVPWERDQKDIANLWSPPPDGIPYTKAEILEYWDLCDGMVDGLVEPMDLEADTCGFWWYKMPKLDHQLMNIRHIQQHAGQLSERLMDAGVETEWSGG